MIIQLVKKFPLIKHEGLLLCSRTLQLDHVLSQFQFTYLHPMQCTSTHCSSINEYPHLEFSFNNSKPILNVTLFLINCLLRLLQSIFTQ